MNSTPLVSVALATYQGEAYLVEQLDSILGQTWENLEVVVSDDRSTDRTWAILKEYEKSGRVRAQQNPQRLGVYRNFEKAISNCRGEYIALSDQDDRWKPEKIATLVEAIGAHALVYGRVEEVLEANGAVTIEPVAAEISGFARRHGSGRAVDRLLAENWVVSHSLMFRRSVLEKALPFPESYPHHDWWLAIAAATTGGIQFLDRSLQLYRRHERSVTFRSAEDRERAESERRRSALSGLRKRWRDRCPIELRRLDETAARLPLNPRERQVLERLRTYFRCGVEPGWRVRAAFAGAATGRLFATQRGGFTRVRAALKCLLAGY